jgi:hypothetical protein
VVNDLLAGAFNQFFDSAQSSTSNNRKKSKNGGNKMKKKAENLEIQPLNEDVLANLSIEDLEERLELQLLHVTEAQGCWDCGAECGTFTIRVDPAPAPVDPGDGGGGGGGGGEIQPV